MSGNLAADSIFSFLSQFLVQDRVCSSTEIHPLYENTIVYVRTNHGKSRPSEITVEMQQASNLSPLLFTVDEAVKIHKKEVKSY